MLRCPVNEGSTLVLGPRRNVPSIEADQVQRLCDSFFGPNFVPPEWRSPLNRGVPKERFHSKRLSFNLEK